MLAWLGGKRKLLEASSQRGRNLANHGGGLDSGLLVGSNSKGPLKNRKVPKQQKYQTSSRGTHQQLMPGATTSQGAHKRQRRDHCHAKEHASIDMVMVMGHTQAHNLTAGSKSEQAAVYSSTAYARLSRTGGTDAAAPEVQEQTSASCASTTATVTPLTPTTTPASQQTGSTAAQSPEHSTKPAAGAPDAPNVQVSSRVPERNLAVVVAGDHHHAETSSSGTDCLQLRHAVPCAQLTSSQAIKGPEVLQAAKQTEPASLDLLFLAGPRPST